MTSKLNCNRHDTKFPCPECSKRLAEKRIKHINGLTHPCKCAMCNDGKIEFDPREILDSRRVKRDGEGSVHEFKVVEVPSGKLMRPEGYEAFLKQAGQGCISGNIYEWPQLKPACRWALLEIERLRKLLKSVTINIEGLKRFLDHYTGKEKGDE